MKPRDPQMDLFTPRAATPPIPEVRENDPNVELFVRLLQERDWTPAKHILEQMGKAVTEDNKRWLRALRKASNGRIAGGPGMPGYKLTLSMTAEEYKHWRHTMRSQTREMLRAVIQADRVFFNRTPIEPNV
jgi:hypothetical protein